MARPMKFGEQDYYIAALALAAAHGPGAVAIASVSERPRAPTGSFYHVLLGALWLYRAVVADHRARAKRANANSMEK
jgi:hypothetical protein